jgi:hypothetical protein
MSVDRQARRRLAVAGTTARLRNTAWRSTGGFGGELATQDTTGVVLNIDSIAEALATQGWSVVEKFVSRAVARA